jgi:hypothetical protein
MSLKHIKNTPHLGSIESRIPRDKALTCEPCGVSFRQPHLLALHEKTLKHIQNTPHLGSVESRLDKALTCEPCEESFFNFSMSCSAQEDSQTHQKHT